MKLIGKCHYPTKAGIFVGEFYADGSFDSKPFFNEETIVFRPDPKDPDHTTWEKLAECDQLRCKQLLKLLIFKHREALYREFFAKKP